ncbi:MAG TPA: TMEM175 family protein [Devosiaceae bacterium]|nr:TMEM175 family protein [Devosiaceae bacterium]
MGSGRLEAFSDGVLAIIITIMVLELHPPHSPDLASLLQVAPPLLSYILSFTYVAIYWNNHHHMFQTVTSVDGSILWGNNLLLFCLSLIPFATQWMGENHFEGLPVAFYGLVLLLAALAYFLLERLIIRHGKNSTLAAALGPDWKGKISPWLYAAGIGLAFVNAVISQILYVAVALIWLVPDRRIERRLVTEPVDDK